MIWTYIFNPYSKIPDKALMITGIITFIIGCFISYSSQILYDGVLDAHSSPLISYVDALTANMINVIVMCILLFALGKYINPKTRMIDILNTSFLYRVPIYVVALIAGLPIQKQFEKKLTDNISNIHELQFTSLELVYIFIFSIITLLMIAYCITLIVNGLRTASNVKKWQHFVSLGVVIIIAEIVSKIIINLL